MSNQADKSCLNCAGKQSPQKQMNKHPCLKTMKNEWKDNMTFTLNSFLRVGCGLWKQITHTMCHLQRLVALGSVNCLMVDIYYDGREWWRAISVLICLISYSRTQSSNPSNCLIILHNLTLPLLSKHLNTINSIWPHTVNRHQAQFIWCYPLLCNYS